MLVKDHRLQAVPSLNLQSPNSSDADSITIILVTAQFINNWHWTGEETFAIRFATCDIPV